MNTKLTGTRWRGLKPYAMFAAMLALIAGILVGGSAFSARSALGSAGKTGGTQPGSVTTSSDQARALISSTLQNKQGKVDIVVMHNVSASAALHKLSPDLHTRAYTMPDGSTESIGSVDAALLTKIASVAGVQWVGGAQDGVPDQIGPDGPKKATGPVEKVKKTPGVKPVNAVAGSGAQPALSPNSTSDWFDVLDGHRAREAWTNGYDGTGVTVAVADSGVDFGHPDLQNSFARIQGGVYNGWPYAYDNYGTAYWEFFGEAQTVDSFLAGSYSLYADTSETMTAPSNVATTHSITVPNAYEASGVSHIIYTMPRTSKSGIVHIGFHPDGSLPLFGWTAAGNQPALVVVDEHTAGVYDTVYVDLDDDHDFTNDVPMTKNSPVAALDWNADGIADESGGMLYWIADGTHANPGAYLWSNSPRIAGAGDLVGIMFTNDLSDIAPGLPGQVAGGSHGLQCASSVAAQGVIAGDSEDGYPVPSYKTGPGGMVWGTGHNAKVAAFTVYSLYDYGVTSNLYGALGPDGVPNSGDEVQVSSNSYGSSEIDNDGWDVASRQYAQINYDLNSHITFLSSTGNGGAGYGTVAAPGGGNTVIGVGASTSYGSTTAFDIITNTNQITYGDVQSWSNRGPSSTGRSGANVLANGAWGAGDYPINEVFEGGNSAYEAAWGGTSKSSPTAAGIAALVVGAYKQGHGGQLPTWSDMRHILMSTANDTGADAYMQGAGVLDAVRATDAAAKNQGLIASPSSLQPGSFNGVSYGQDDSFANIMAPGGSATNTISVTNASPNVAGAFASASMLKATSVMTVTLNTDHASESAPDFARPDYLPFYMSKAQIPGNATLMVAQLVYPFEQFNPTLDPNATTASLNSFRLIPYDWTDLNGDGVYWSDTTGDGVVNAGEVEPYEVNRFNYGYDRSNTLEVTVGNPKERVHNGLYLAVQRRSSYTAAPNAALTIRITFYSQVPWSWMTFDRSNFTISPNGVQTFNLTTNVPAGTQPGMYEGFINLKQALPANTTADGVDAGFVDRTSTQIPISIAVAGSSASFSFGGQGRGSTPYDNNVVWGYQDYDWRTESGDWRFYYTNVPSSEVAADAGNFWLVNTKWYNYTVPTTTIPTDIDTYLYGPTADESGVTGGSNVGGPFGPYTLGYKGGSNNTNIGGTGRWSFQTATGSTEEWVSGGLTSGLNLVEERTTNFNGRQVDEPFSGKAGVLSVNPYPVVVTQTCATDVSLTVSSTLSLSPLSVLASGLSQTITSTQTVTQDGNTDYRFTLTHPALLDVKTVSGGPNPAQDVDLEVYRVDGASLIPVGSSASATANEEVRQVLPPAGEYLVRLVGYAVSPSPGSVLLVLNNIDGTDLTVTGVPASVSAGHPGQVTFTTSGNLAPGTYNGAIILGPSVAPSAAFIPVTVVVTGTCGGSPSVTVTAAPSTTVTAAPSVTTTPGTCPAITFNDVATTDYFYGPVQYLYCKGAISGYADNTFRPYNTTTRSQLVKIVVVAEGFPLTTPTTPTFSDVLTDNPFYAFVETAVARGVISGYADHTFKPYNEVTRGQIAKIIVVAESWTLQNPATPSFADVPTTNNFYSYIETAYAHNIISGYNCGSPEACPGLYYRPAASATRGQLSKIIYLALTYGSASKK